MKRQHLAASYAFSGEGDGVGSGGGQASDAGGLGGGDAGQPMREETLRAGQAGSGKKEAGSPTTSSEEGEAGVELLAAPSWPRL